MQNLLILIIDIIILLCSICSIIIKSKKGRQKDDDTNAENAGDDSKDTLHFGNIKFELIIVIATFVLAGLAIQVKSPTNYSDNGGIMNRPDAVVRFGDYSWPTQVWYSYDSSKDPLERGTLYTEPFVPNQSGELYYRAKFLWVKSDRESFYVKAYNDILDEAGISEGSMDSVPIADFMPVSSADTEDESSNGHIPVPSPGPENRVISQDYMPDEDNSPGEIKWGWGDTTEGGQGRESYTVEDINNGLLGSHIVFNSISNSTIGDEKNFVAARVVGDNEGLYNVWNSNLIEVETGKEYYIRIYGHNNSPYAYEAIADDVKVMYMIPQGSGKTIVVNSQISSSNADPDRYWDSVVLTCKDRFHLEYLKGSALLENNGIGAGGGINLSDDIINDWVNVGFDALDGKIPGCYKYDFYITIRVRAVDGDFEY